MRALKLRRVRNNGKLTWCLDLRASGDGRQFFKDKETADQLLEKYKSEYEHYGRRAFDLSPEERTAFQSAKNRLAKVGATIDEAVAFFELYGKRKGDMHLGSARRESLTAPVILDGAIGRLIEDRRHANARERYLKQLRSTLNQFSEGREQMLVSSVTMEMVKDWLNSNGWEPKTKQGKLIDLQTFFSFCKDSGWCTVIPCPPRDSIALDEKGVGILSVENLTKLFKAARKHEPTLIPYFALATFCGIRPEELSKMTWQDVNIAERFAEVRAEVAKTRKRRVVTLSDNCIAWLRLGGELPVVNFKRKFDRVREKAGIEWPSDCLRHSFGSYHLAKHRSAALTQSEMGHRSEDLLFNTYRDIVRPADAEAFWNISPRKQKAKK